MMTLPLQRHTLNLRLSLGLAAGLLSGTLTISVPAFFGAFAAANDFALFFTPFCLGSIFGLVFIAYFWIFLNQRDVLKALLFTAASTVAYAAAWWSTFWCASWRGSNFRTPDSPSAFFLGGTIGAFIVLFAAQLLFSERSFRNSLWRSFGWCLFGGVLGSLGWALGPSLGNVVFLVVFPSSKGVDSLPAYSFSCFLVWQTGIGQILDNLVAPPDESETTETSAAPRFLPVWLSVTLFLVLLAFAIGWLANDKPAGPRPWSFLSGQAGRAAEEPPLLARLPYAESTSAGLVVISGPIAGYRTASADFLGSRAAVFDTVTDKPSSPESRHYVGHYALPVTASVAERTVEVDIQEFPDSQWAEWLLRKQTAPPIAVDRVKQFNNSIFSFRTPANSDYSLFLWTSGRFLLRVQFNGGVSDDFLRTYLQKYPSSL